MTLTVRRVRLGLETEAKIFCGVCGIAKFYVYRDKPQYFSFSVIDRDFPFFSASVNWVGTLIRGRVDQSLQNLTSRYKS